jgi:hypothetical protein
MKKVLVLAFVVFAPDLHAGSGQDAPAPPARAADVASVDAIVKALYDTISGPAGQKRDWDRFRSLFAPGASLIPTRIGRDGQPAQVVVTDVAKYIELSEPYFAKEPFYEVEIARKTDSFGAVTHVFSTYESRKAPDDKPFIRGINSFQIFHDGSRYWVLTVFWDNERPGLEIPPEYLPKP